MESDLLEVAVEAGLEARLPAGTTRADFCTGRFRTTADVLTGERRLLDVLRDTTRHYLDVRRLRVLPSEALDAVPVEYTEGLLHKADIDWVAVRAEPPRAEGRLYSLVKKSPVRVALVLGEHRIEGNVFVENASTDPVSFFLRGVEKSSERFVAVTGASISSASGHVDEAGLVIVNRGAIRIFSVVR
jgi:hypothetical protein